MSYCKSKLFFLLILGLIQIIPATSQWSRKYKTACITCHSAFPRLNYFGERFLRNGYQDPDAEIKDGDKEGKIVLDDKTTIDKVNNWLGARLNMTPIKIKTNAITVEDKKESQISIGNTDWLQLFIAGSISKNISIFIENEFKEKSFHFSWYHVGFHNLAGSYVNFFVGNVSPRDYGAFPNRLRVLGPVKNDVFLIKSSGGQADDGGVNLSSSRPAIQYFGYKGPVLVWAGIGPGGHAADIDQNKHYWGGGRFEITEDMESPLEGSALSLWAYKGKDSKDISTDSALFNDFTRASVETEIRFSSFELQSAYVWGMDENWYLTQSKVLTEFTGIAMVGGYMLVLPNQMGLLYPALQYDQIFSDDLPQEELQIITPSISFFPRRHIRLGIYGRFDLADGDKHDIFLNIRTMF